MLKSLSLLLLLSVTVSCMRNGTASISTLDHILKNYDKRIRPNQGFGPTLVNVTAYILRAYDYDDDSHSFRVDAYFRQSWIDERLQFTPKRGESDTIFADSDARSQFWIPDTFCASSTDVDLSSTQNTFTRIRKDGFVHVSNFVGFQVRCDGNVASFPFEKKKCELRFGSYGITMDDIVYSFDEKQAPYAVGRDKDFKLLGFTLREMEYGDRHVRFTTGKYSSVFIKFEFTRNLAPYVAHVYLPMILMVLLSFTPFLMKGELVVRVFIAGVSIVGGLIIMNSFDSPMELNSFLIFNVVSITTMCCSLLITACLPGYEVVWDATKDSSEHMSTRAKAAKRSIIGLLCGFCIFLVAHFLSLLLSR